MSETHDLTVYRIIKAPRAAIWQAWADPRELEKWWTPHPVQTIVQKMELRPGGAFNTVIRLEDGTEFSGNGCFLDVVEHERIVFTDTLEEGWKPSPEPFFTAIITLADHPEGTKYTARALHKDEADRQKHKDMGFEEGWGICIDQLGKLAEQFASGSQ